MFVFAANRLPSKRSSSLGMLMCCKWWHQGKKPSLLLLLHSVPLWPDPARPLAALFTLLTLYTHVVPMYSLHNFCISMRCQATAHKRKPKRAQSCRHSRCLAALFAASEKRTGTASISLPWTANTELRTMLILGSVILCSSLKI